jgi:hypothetical protein
MKGDTKMIVRMTVAFEVDDDTLTPLEGERLVRDTLHEDECFPWVSFNSAGIAVYDNWDAKEPIDEFIFPS